MSNLKAPFGKHKGKTIAEFIHDESYLKWLVTCPWFQFAVSVNEELKKSGKSYIPSSPSSSLDESKTRDSRK